MTTSSEEYPPSEPSAGGASAEAAQGRRWQPIGPIERRVLGVLVEKAKTTPDVYPLSLNAVTTGANQKSNRAPVMQLEPEDVEAALDRLRALGAVGLVEGYGRVPKYRHYFYDWLGVDKVEAAVMAELLLRGPQTEGELRAHASRMEPLADLAALRQVLQSLKQKGLVVSLTPEGRGHVVGHALYPPREMERLQAQYHQAAQPIRPEALTPRETESKSASYAAGPSTAGAGFAVGQPREMASNGSFGSASLQAELEDLRRQLAELQHQVQSLAETSRHHDETLAWLRKQLGV